MALHAPKVLRAGAYPAWGVYANVFMGRDDTRVEYRVDGGDWMPMRRVSQPDPRLLVENMRRSEEHTSELQSLMRNSYAVFCLKKKKNIDTNSTITHTQLKVEEYN